MCKLEFDCLWAVVDMELSGMALDMKKWKVLQGKYKQEQKIVSLKLQKELGNGGVQMNIFGEELTGGINLDSQTQIKKALKSKRIELESTSYADLLQYKDRSEVVEWLIDYRRVSKAIQGFLSPIPEWINSASNRIHSSYRQIGSQSGRFSCGNPNIQQIPRGKEFRDRFFKAYKGIASWHFRVKKETNVTASRTLSGRRCVYSEQPPLSTLLNIPVQGTAADINKRALALLVPIVKALKGKIVASVHDEIILEVQEDRAEEAAIQLKNTMEKAGAYYLKFVPVIAEATIADSWAEK